MDQSPFISGARGRGRILGGITRFSGGIEGGSVYRGLWKINCQWRGGSNKNTTKLRGGVGGGGEKQVNLIVTRPKILRPEIFL